MWIPSSCVLCLYEAALYLEEEGGSTLVTDVTNKQNTIKICAILHLPGVKAQSSFHIKEEYKKNKNKTTTKTSKIIYI